MVRRDEIYSQEDIFISDFLKSIGPLSYLTLSLQTTLGFQTHSKEIGKVVSPEAWVFHKGLTFARRKSSLKALKDLYGIWYVVTQLGTLSDRSLVEFGAVAQQHPKWFATFRKNIHNWMENASPAEWFNLESQDPSGQLKKLSFEQALRKVLQNKL
ncbi:MAG: hypothetical protein S4CHLAM2_05780 [Chlamydiales bacterium]|nr:hypothetical protein [Chlamydiales bacterium]